MRRLALASTIVLTTSACGAATEPAGHATATAPRDAPASTTVPTRTEEEAAPAAARPAVPRTLDWVLRRLDGERITVEGRPVRLDASTLTCGADGPPDARIRGRPAWARFRCTQPTFPPGVLAGPDAEFELTPVESRGYEVARARFSAY
jgi:hypothetical protein